MNHFDFYHVATPGLAVVGVGVAVHAAHRSVVQGTEALPLGPAAGVGVLNLWHQDLDCYQGSKSPSIYFDILYDLGALLDYFNLKNTIPGVLGPQRTLPGTARSRRAG